MSWARFRVVLLKTAILRKSYGFNYSVDDTCMSHVSNVWPPLDPKGISWLSLEDAEGAKDGT